MEQLNSRIFHLGVNSTFRNSVYHKVQLEEERIRPAQRSRVWRPRKQFRLQGKNKPLEEVIRIRNVFIVVNAIEKTLHWDKLEVVNITQMSTINFFHKFDGHYHGVKGLNVIDIVQKKSWSR